MLCTWGKSISDAEVIINSTKSKYLLISRNNKDGINNFIIDNIFMESVKEFCYLGIIINNKNLEEQEIKHRIMKPIEHILTWIKYYHPK